jgi:mRNA-degrading endonuclease RelE of RelBE toxin-antitoxin system
MKTEVLVADQVRRFVRSLAPQPRHALTRAIKRLERGEGDIKRLEGKLVGFLRLRVSGYRVLFKETARRRAHHQLRLCREAQRGL